MESKEDLDAKIGEYSAQLAQVNQFLISDPNNVQFLKLRQDLEKVIDLTNLINSQNDPISSSSNSQRGHKEDEDNDDLEDNNSVEDEADGAAEDEDKNKITGAIQVGECVEVLGGDRPYPGTVTGIIDEATYKVKYFEFETEVSLPSSSLFRIAPASEFNIDPEDVKVGQKGVYQCKYATDQVLYDAVVQNLTPNGCVVKYTLYGNVEEAPLAYLKTIFTQLKKGSTEVQHGLIALPDNLRFLPTDTDEDKARKRKKIKAIKSKNRLFTKEEEINAVQSSWQKFASKTTKKSGSMVPKKSSMFASSDAVDGKIGVTNSGQGMSQFAQRKKHKF